LTSRARARAERSSDDHRVNHRDAESNHLFIDQGRPWNIVMPSAATRSGITHSGLPGRAPETPAAGSTTSARVDQSQSPAHGSFRHLGTGALAPPRRRWEREGLIPSFTMCGRPSRAWGPSSARRPLWPRRMAQGRGQENVSVGGDCGDGLFAKLRSHAGPSPRSLRAPSSDSQPPRPGGPAAPGAARRGAPAVRSGGPGVRRAFRGESRIRAHPP
jgi:hypothetical protein